MPAGAPANANTVTRKITVPAASGDGEGSVPAVPSPPNGNAQSAPIVNEADLGYPMSLPMDASHGDDRQSQALPASAAFDEQFLQPGEAKPKKKVPRKSVAEMVDEEFASSASRDTAGGRRGLQVYFPSLPTRPRW